MNKVFFILILSIPGLLTAQSLKETRERFEIENQKRIERVLEYADKHQIPVIQQLESGVTICIKDVINGVPEFIKTYNLGAAVTTGANVLGINGSLGLDLDGNDVSIAIWDGGLVRTTHNELVGRITPKDGSSSLNFHATHVAGTILSKGLNATSKGMAINATANTFDFNNDDSEMLQYAMPDQSGTILSNHSYGSISGWDDGTWYGDENISELEDWKFGFYTVGAKSWDNMAYNSPYYTIVKSAGNDRGDSGNGTHPSDGPYDIISTNGTAKNIITIGAVNKLTTYNSPIDVVMSSFSGWGPTDDGRIKPDFVAAGVGLFSTFESANDAYGSLSGTSMSAPNATGTFALLQQLHKELNGGNLMKSALLKGLVAHTAHEAGANNGPDYAFGWGLINAVGAADILIKENGLDKRIEEIRLLDGQSYELNLSPQIGEKVKATICWTDPAGTVPAISLDPTDLILVNDLDLRVTNVEETHEPWILNPASPGAAASKGDNFRDNIEVIEFTPTSEQYTLTISHKNSLTNDHQDVFLILTYEDINNTVATQYWIGDDGDFSLSSNWSSQTGGPSNGQSPTSLTSLIFDNNSFSSESTDVALGISSNTTINDFIYLSDKTVTFDLGANDLTITGKMSTNQNIQFTGTGRIVFDTDGSKVIGSATSLSEMEINFNNANGEWLIGGDLTAKNIVLESGHLNFGGNKIIVDQLIVNSLETKTLTLDNSSLTIREEGSIMADGLTISDIGTNYILEGSSVSLNTFDIPSNGSLIINGNGTTNGFSSFEAIDVEGELNINNSLIVLNLSASYGSSLILSNSVQVTIDNIEITGNAEMPLSISSETEASFFIDGHRKICLESLAITNVDLLGSATVSVGTESTIDNSDGWVGVTCEDALLSDFTHLYGCSDSFVYFTNLSEGSFESVEWDFNGLGTSQDSNPYFVFTTPGEYTITLTISSGENSSVYSKDITIIPNELSAAEISIVGEVFFSAQIADTYQWYRDGEIIEGATQRFYQFGNELGEFFVVLFYETCNVPSNTIELVVAGVDESNSIQLYPNPTNGILNVNSISRQFKLEIIDSSGKLIHTEVGNGNNSGRYDLSHLEAGMYLVGIQIENRYVVTRLIIK